ncbi:MAG: transglutaminase-like cysteine peptidase [Alphaproteobacteria bacterium]|nr:transglutaminase-like cysteine peptidase [Alphaproteobacteria bacterium]
MAAEETPPKAESPGIEPETEPKAAMKAAPEKQSQPEQAKPAGSRAAELAAKLRAARGAPPKKKRPPAAKKDESTSTSSPPPKATEDKAGGKTRKKKELVKAAPDKAKSSKKGAPIPLFGTKEVRSANLKPFPKWTGVIDRYFSDANVKKGSCEKTKFNKCHLKAWKSFLKKIEGKDRKTQIKKVNDFMNRAKYIVDTKNYQQPDYWATPGQFFNKNGDCEDYAIAKYMSLRALGFGNEDMRIVVLQDLNLKIPHAVLAVYTDNGPVLLDNQIPQVIPAKSVFHYKPVYSMNENFWWLHRG